MAFEIPRVQRAAVIDNPGPQAQLVLRDDAPIDEPGPNEVLVKLAVSGVCRSELRAFLGWAPYQSIVGHEGVGIVVKQGPGAAESLLGQRVGVKWLYSACGRCPICARGFPNNCPEQVNTGRHVPGTLQQYVVADARYLTKIPDGLASEVAAPLLCAGLTMVGAVAKLEEHLTSGDWVVISGSGGGLGHLGVQIANLKGYRVIGVDSGASKRDLTMSSGAHSFLDFATEDVEKRVKQLTGSGAQAVLVVSGSESAFELAPKLVQNMGLIVGIGLPPNTFNIPIPASLCSARALTISGVATGTEQQMEALLQDAAAGKIKPSIKLSSFSSLPEIFNKLKDDGVTGRIVVVIP
ncbi:GroES-like protein [Thozetella sp. PMI_491]|nr:GroES-like protein [Thozetella sp. PMI_491]